MKKTILWALVILFSSSVCFAEDLTILFSGQTFGMIYPCNCPLEPDGGVSRRATLVKKIREASKEALLVDTGDFFAGGKMDQYSQNAPLDMQRSIFHLKAMELLGFDAVAIGENEFGFGEEFLAQSIAKSKIPFLSANIRGDKVLPYIEKDVEGIKVGII
ncbi:MAG: hypothetical protein KKC84_04525, partial [Candidatus Omnitrophica bacterium]|nr:hypothetical protein [Candidatus Omnitrophota bacterium]